MTIEDKMITPTPVQPELLYLFLMYKNAVYVAAQFAHLGHKKNPMRSNYLVQPHDVHCAATSPLRGCISCIKLGFLKLVVWPTH